MNLHVCNGALSSFFASFCSSNLTFNYSKLLILLIFFIISTVPSIFKSPQCKYLSLLIPFHLPVSSAFFIFYFQSILLCLSFFRISVDQTTLVPMQYFTVSFINNDNRWCVIGRQDGEYRVSNHKLYNIHAI